MDLVARTRSPSATADGKPRNPKTSKKGTKQIYHQLWSTIPLFTWWRLGPSRLV